MPIIGSVSPSQPLVQADFLEIEFDETALSTSISLPNFDRRSARVSSLHFTVLTGTVTPGLVLTLQNVIGSTTDVLWASAAITASTIYRPARLASDTGGGAATDAFVQVTVQSQISELAISSGGGTFTATVRIYFESI